MSFQENLKTVRKQRGLSQEALAAQLHVVRQTVSKWEKGLSVPDAQMLIRLSEILEVPVSALLGGEEMPAPETDESRIAQQLAQINEQLAIKNRRARKIWKVVLGVLIGFAVLTVLLLILSIVGVQMYQFTTSAASQRIS